ncbi:MAG TPA: DUF4129 domain-containing protein, partial [Polyangia bacterium]
TLLIPPLRARLYTKKGTKTSDVTGPTTRLGFAAAMAAAREALAAGRLADCVRAVWLATIALLEQGGLSPAREARADWEHVRAATRLRPDLEPTLRSLVTSFQRAHFGGVSVSQEEAASCLAQLEGLSQRLPKTPEAPEAGGHG